MHSHSKEKLSIWQLLASWCLGSFENEVVAKEFDIRSDGGDVAAEAVVLTEGRCGGVGSLFVVLNESEGGTHGDADRGTNDQ